MRAAVALWNIVGETEYILLVGIIPLHRNFDDNFILFHLYIDHLIVNRRFVFVEVLNEGANTALILKQVFLVTALIYQVDAYTRVQKRQFPQAFGENIVVKLDITKNFRAGQKPQLCSGLVGILDFFEITLRLTHFIFLGIQLSLALDAQ